MATWLPYKTACESIIIINVTIIAKFLMPYIAGYNFLAISLRLYFHHALQSKVRMTVV